MATPPRGDGKGGARSRRRLHTGGGRVELTEEAARLGVVSGEEDLDALKARIVLVVALGAREASDALGAHFRKLAGELSSN